MLVTATNFPKRFRLRTRRSVVHIFGDSDSPGQIAGGFAQDFDVHTRGIQLRFSTPRGVVYLVHAEEVEARRRLLGDLGDELPHSR